MPRVYIFQRVLVILDMMKAPAELLHLGCNFRFRCTAVMQGLVRQLLPAGGPPTPADLASYAIRIGSSVPNPHVASPSPSSSPPTASLPPSLPPPPSPVLLCVSAAASTGKPRPGGRSTVRYAMQCTIGSRS